ncbi:hypothetical protein [Amycolatopsis panacis]|uniref:Uncharacterized protein n=1 Tax=Amycolatopsis panacis TaxID=2340917 RepID=A0A419I3L4_9PSEU|nr:hypothetical protein [Amycolatopsis panacis]RJQ84759.1 hypothetical protein D5S19_15960 [Amycolatopsis panacis]
MNQPDTEARRVLAREQAEGLRALARLIEQHPALTRVLAFPLGEMRGYVVDAEDDARGTLAEFRRAALAAGAEVSTANEIDACTVGARFGPVTVSVKAKADLMAGQPAPPVSYIPLNTEED